MFLHQVLSWVGLAALLLSVVGVAAVGLRFYWQRDLRPKLRDYLTEVRPQDRRMLVMAFIMFALGWCLLIVGQAVLG